MTKKIEDICVTPNQTIREALTSMDKGRYGIVLVVDDDKHLAGTITDGDIRRAVLSNQSFEQPVSVLLKKKESTPFAKPITAKKGQSSDAYLKILRKHGVLHLPLLENDGRVAGLVCKDDLVNEDLPVQAVLMAGGAGTRLYPLTKDMPKPMLPVGDRPLMEIIIKQLRNSGIRNVNITTHYEREKITNHFKDGREFDVNVSYTSEEKPLGTAGGLALLEPTSQTLLVMNGDILTDVDFRVMLSYHKEQKADLTVAVRQYDVKVPYGVVECTDHNVTRVVEKPVYNFFVNAGIYLLEPHVLQHIPRTGEKLDMTDLISRLIDHSGSVASFPILEEWIDIGQRKDYKFAQQIVKEWKKAQ